MDAIINPIRESSMKSPIVFSLERYDHDICKSFIGILGNDCLNISSTSEKSLDFNERVSVSIIDADSKMSAALVQFFYGHET